MKTADEMFEELGYIEQMYYDNDIIFRRDSSHCSGREIHFSLRRRNISLPSTITLEEFQAINKKVEELGWIK